jgi:hypothetical protein
MEIKQIGVGDIQIRSLNIPPVITQGSNFFDAQVPVPVVVNIGLPIVDVPGCVEAHETNNPKNNQVSGDDPKGTITFCDAGVPNFSPIQYEPEQMIITRPAPVDTRMKEKPEAPKPTEDLPTPPAAEVPKTPEIECPTQKQLLEEPVGFVFDGGRQRVTGYELQGNQCVRLVEDVKILEQVVNAIPPAGVITTTATIAVVATTSALLAKPFADILLKVIKPTIKKVLKKVAAIRGKQMKILSVKERREEQRDRNQAIAKLKSVAAKTKKKG